MPKVNVAVEAAAAGLGRAQAMTLTDAHMDRATAALKVFYGQVDDGNGGLRDRTANEAWDALFDGYKRSLVDIVRKVEAEAAKASAEGKVSDIVMS